MQTLNSGNLVGSAIPFPGGTVEIVWDAASGGTTGTLVVERMSNAFGANSTWTQIGATGVGAGVAQLTAPGTLVVTAGPCLLRLRAITPSADIVCDVARCHAGRILQD